MAGDDGRVTPTSPLPPADPAEEPARLTVDLTRSHDGRLEGTIRSKTREPVPFSGVLELLWALEELLQERPSNGPHGAGSV